MQSQTSTVWSEIQLNNVNKLQRYCEQNLQKGNKRDIVLVFQAAKTIKKFEELGMIRFDSRGVDMLGQIAARIISIIDKPSLQYTLTGFMNMAAECLNMITFAGSLQTRIQMYDAFLEQAGHRLHRYLEHNCTSRQPLEGLEFYLNKQSHIFQVMISNSYQLHSKGRAQMYFKLNEKRQTKLVHERFLSQRNSKERQIEIEVLGMIKNGKKKEILLLIQGIHLINRQLNSGMEFGQLCLELLQNFADRAKKSSSGNFFQSFKKEFYKLVTSFQDQFRKKVNQPLGKFDRFLSKSSQMLSNFIFSMAPREEIRKVLQGYFYSQTMSFKNFAYIMKEVDVNEYISSQKSPIKFQQSQTKQRRPAKHESHNKQSRNIKSRNNSRKYKSKSPKKPRHRSKHLKDEWERNDSPIEQSSSFLNEH